MRSQLGPGHPRSAYIRVHLRFALRLLCFFAAIPVFVGSCRTANRKRIYPHEQISVEFLRTLQLQKMPFAFSCDNIDNALRKSVAIDSTLVRIRLTQPSDAAELAQLYFALWPDSSVDAHRRELDALFEGKPPSTLPLINLVVEISDGHLIGFLQASLRSHADGCDPSRPVGFIEGF
jgi:hypothetical protein